MTRLRIPVTRALIATGVVAVAASRAWTSCRRWGASEDEVTRDLPGDEFLAAVDVTATRAITVHRPSSDVWPWVAQLGQGRGGFYSYDFVENLVGCRIHSADRIVPAWQSIEVGTEVALTPEVDLRVVAVDIGKAIVLRGAPPMFGRPAPYDFTWAFVLDGQPDGTTRLIVRERYRYVQRWAALLVEPVQPISFLMSQKMLRGIRDRAQYTSAGAVREGRAGPAHPSYVPGRAA